MSRIAHLILLLIVCAGIYAAPAGERATDVAGHAGDGYIETGDGIRLYYRRVGEGRDPIVVLHGGPGLDQGYLAPDLAPLGQSHALVYYDQRGAGRSTVVSDPESLRIDAYIADLEAVRRHLGIERLTLLGHSWGALLAARYALEHPENVSRLILVSPGPVRLNPYHDQWFQRVTAWMDADTLAELQAREAAHRDATKASRDTCLALFELFKRGYFHDPADTAMFGRMRGDFCTAPQAAIRNFWTVNALTLESLGAFDWREDFRGLEVPVLVITGVRDVFPAENFREWEAAFPEARLILLEGAGHYPHVERPEAFFAAVREFLH